MSEEGKLDQLVDTGLDELMTGEPTMTGEAFDHGRARLLAAMRADTSSGNEDIMTVVQEAPATPVAPPRRRARWLAAAAAVAAVTVGVLVAQTLTGGGVPQASAAEVLTEAADLAENVTDRPVGPGEYLHVSRRWEGITFYAGEDAVSRGAGFQDTWIPADPREPWFERRGEIGSPSWLPGHEGSGEPEGIPAALIGEWTAPCGAYSYYGEVSEWSCDNGDWANPTPEFLAGLPTDSRQLYERLVADSGSEDDAVITVGDTLASGRIPAEYRALLYRAVAHAPNLRVTDDVATLDGRTGTALGIDAYGLIWDFIIDPDSGEFIGYREVLSAEEHGVPVGTVRAWTAVTTSVVDEPAR
jgi:hypothetical protein